MNIEMIEPIDDVVLTPVTPIANTPVATPTSDALAIVNTQVAKFVAIEAGFAELEKRYSNVVYAVDTPAGLDEAKKARLEIRNVRFNAQNLLKETTKPLNQIKADVIALADKIVARIVLTEDPIDEQIKAAETRKATEKAAKEQAERELAAKVQASFTALQFDTSLIGQPAGAILLAIDTLDAIEISIEVFGARAGEALQLKMKTLDTLEAMHVAAQAQATALAEIAAARQKLIDDQAAAAAAQAVEAQRLADERAQLAADKRIADMAAEATAAAARKVAQDKLDEAARVKREADAAAQKVLDDAAAAERKRLDDIAAAERAETARVAEEQRQAQAIKDAATKRLHDAAPALLHALEMVRDAYRDNISDGGKPGITDIAMGVIERAIEQATGVPARTPPPNQKSTP